MDLSGGEDRGILMELKRNPCADDGVTTFEFTASLEYCPIAAVGLCSVETRKVHELEVRALQCNPLEQYPHPFELVS